MADAGIDIHPFFKVTFPEFATRVNWRNHRKITVIDNRIGYIGGMNVADRYVSATKWNVARHASAHHRTVGARTAAFVPFRLGIYGIATV